MTGIKNILLALLGLALGLPVLAAPLVDATNRAPDLLLEIRYHGSDNFVGEPIDGYRAARCLLTAEAATALAHAQAAARAQGLTLKVFDCYRPQRAVDHFVRWARDAGDTRMKPHYYPRVDKSRLFAEGYIAERSGHSRGSTLDVTLVDSASGRELVMGTDYDYFDPLSHTANAAIDPEAQANRRRLVALMAAAGFKNLAEEWWHYTLANEPYPDSYFDVPVQ